MSKYILMAAMLILGHVVLYSQGTEQMKKDSISIDSLIKGIPVSKDSARINYLNRLSDKILKSAYPISVKSKWVLPYVELAYREAREINYSIGVAHSLIHLCQTDHYRFIENTRSKIDNTPTIRQWEKHTSELNSLARQINDPEILGNSYDCQAAYFFRTNKQSEQLKALVEALNWYKKAPANESRECENNLNISFTYLDLGEFEKAFEYCNRSLELAKKLVTESSEEVNSVWLQSSYYNMAELYKKAGDYEMAMKLLHEGRQFHFTRKSNMTWDMSDALGELYLVSGNYDSALFYLKPEIMNKKFSYVWPQVAQAYFKSNRVDSALKYYNLAIDSMERRGSVLAVVEGLRRSYYGKAAIFFQQGKYPDALALARKSLAMENQRSNKTELVSTYELMSQIFYRMDRSDSAYLYLLKHNELKNSLVTRQFLWRLENYKQLLQDERKTSQINLLHKDNLLKTQRLKQEGQIRNFLLAGLAGLCITGFLFFRYLVQRRRNDKLKLENEFRVQQLESEKKQAELQQRAVELEMQALRAQMNPHFIFNCLSSINRFIFKNDNKAASDYLTRFSRLIRMVLMHSQKKLVTLEDELEMIRLYLDLERLRFKDAFDYSITTTNIVDAGNVFIPPLLLQPFCENAVWHGLMHKEGKGHVKVSISEVANENGNTLYCIIEDNGVGRAKAAGMKSKSAEQEKSLGLKITTERIALLNRENNISTFFKIDDILNEKNEVSGTRVELNIKHQQTAEEYA